MKLRRTVSLIACLAMLLSTVTGCTSPSTTANSTDTPGTASSNATTPEAKKVIKLAHMFDPSVNAASASNYQWITQSKEQFEAKYPDCIVELEYIPSEGFDSKIISDKIAGIDHGVHLTMTMQLPEHYRNNTIIDMTPYVNKWPQALQDDISWHPNWEDFHSNGKLHSVPAGLQARAMLYRKDMFEAAGLDPEKPPKTMDELLDYAKKLTTKDVYGLGLYLGSDRATTEIAFSPYLWAYGGDLWDANTKEAVFASDAGVKATQFIYDCVNVHKVTPEWSMSGTYTDVIQKPFIAGQYAMVEGYGNYWIQALQDAGMASGVIPATAEATAENIGIFVVPENSARYVNAWSLSVASTCEYPEEASKLIEIMLDWNNLQHFLSGGLPGLQSVYSQGNYSSDFYKQWMQAASTGRSMPATANYMKLADSVAACLQEIMATKADIPTTMKRYQDEYNARYAGE